VLSLRTRGGRRGEFSIPQLELFPVTENNQVIIIIRLKKLETLPSDQARDLIKICESTIKILLKKESTIWVNKVNENIISDAEIKVSLKNVSGKETISIKEVNATINAIYTDLFRQLDILSKPIKIIIWRYKKYKIPASKGYETIILPTISEKIIYRPIKIIEARFIPFFFF